MDLLNWALLLTTAIYGCAAVAFTLGLARSSSLPCPDNSRQVGQDLPFVSVVVAARNEEAFLEDCLSGLVNQTYAPDRFEVLARLTGSFLSESKNSMHYMKLQVIMPASVQKNICIYT